MQRKSKKEGKLNDKAWRRENEMSMKAVPVYICVGLLVFIIY